jgi:hypothetical protein
VVRDDTPYRTRPPSERAHERRCMEELLGRAEAVPTIWEAFGGVGDTGEVLRRLMPGATVYASELDLDCCLEYRRRHGKDSCTHGDSLERARRLQPQGPWAASLDFNRLTIMDLRGRREGGWKVDLINEVLARGPRWCQITDSAVRYLHLNAVHRYGLPTAERADYVQAVAEAVRARWNYRLQCYTGYHAATYLLFVR